MTKHRMTFAWVALGVAGMAAFLGGCALNTEPRAEFTVAPESGFPPLVVAFNGSASTSPNGLIVDYAWQFGDGDTAAGVSVTHTYLMKGEYHVTLEVRDEAGRRSERTRTVLVLNRAPVARFTTNVSTVGVRQPIWFNASESYDPDGEIVEYFWDFGDGTTATGEVVEHEYQSANGVGWRPEVTLTVTDDDGDRDVVSKRSVLVVGCDSCGG